MSRNATFLAALSLAVGGMSTTLLVLCHLPEVVFYSLAAATMGGAVAWGWWWLAAEVYMWAMGSKDNCHNK